jgi:phosphatidylserine/phosphatidylglycerophosphate/cardiolipin synthase-like enzyme
VNAAIISGCLAALGARPDGGLPGLLARTTLDRFEILQTPDRWGHSPADNSYWLAAGGPAPLPAASGRFLAAIEDVIAGAERLVDIASLEPFASGEFAATIRRGLARAARRGQPLTVRVMYGRHRFVSQTDTDFEAAIRDLTADLPDASPLRLHACRMETSNDQKRPSWNHAKIVAADGREAIVGGHNLWHADYLGFAPVHDLSARVVGPPPGAAPAVLDQRGGGAGRPLATPSEIGSLHAIRWAAGRLEPAGPPPPVALVTPLAGSIPALAVGRLGTGVIADPRVANVGAAVAAIAFRQARSSIRISQMDFGFHWEGVNFWSADVVVALADVLTDPSRAVDVQMVLSEPGAKTAAGGPYSFGTTLADIGVEMRRAIGDRPLTGRLRFAPLRFSTSGDCWVHDGVELKIINHAKFWMVDDQAFHVGSDNLYPHNLQEFGYVVESAALAREALTAYWEPLWIFSSRVATDVELRAWTAERQPASPR